MDSGYLYEPTGQRSLRSRFASFCAGAALILLLCTLLYLSSVAMLETVDMNLNNPALENVEKIVVTSL